MNIIFDLAADSYQHVRTDDRTDVVGVIAVEHAAEYHPRYPWYAEYLITMFDDRFAALDGVMVAAPTRKSLETQVATYMRAVMQGAYVCYCEDRRGRSVIRMAESVDSGVTIVEAAGAGMVIRPCGSALYRLPAGSGRFAVNPNADLFAAC